MNIENLYFFDKDGYNLNFKRNERYGYWEGMIFLPKVSVGLYANMTIYVLEKNDEDYFFPIGSGNITFTWDRLNKFVDEFFMFTFDDEYEMKETSALTYTPNDGPDCETLIVNRFDEYDIPLKNERVDIPLPIHIAFSAKENSDATTYNRTLVMSYNGNTIAKIKFYAETVEEDERLKIWNDNLGYNITPEDTIIFDKSDINEYKPDYQLLNEKRKELMMEGSNIYPYIGSYKAIINAIKFFGYENLNIIEYWRNVNPSDENFGKVYHSSKYSLTHKETLRIGARTIKLPNKNYKKMNALALVYNINEPIGEVDEWELPKVRENFRYTIEIALIKLFALRKKLNKEFMPGTSRIIDVIGEASYFGLKGIKKINSTFKSTIFGDDKHIDFDILPSKYIHLTDDRYFDKYILENVSDGNDYKNEQINVIYDIANKKINEVDGQQVYQSKYHQLTEDIKCDLYIDYYNALNVDYIRQEDETHDDEFAQSSAKVVLSYTPFEVPDYKIYDTKYIEDVICSDKYDTLDEIVDDSYKLVTGELEKVKDKKIEKIYKGVIGEEIDFVNDIPSWVIEMSIDQNDEELNNIGVVKAYDRKDFSIEKSGNRVLVNLPYVGYYDVKLMVGENTFIKKKCIKVEPYQLELKGFYYDARALPDNLMYDMPDDMDKFILDKLRDMTAWAVTEKTAGNENVDLTMPTYTSNGEINYPGPYQWGNISEEWFIPDNLTYGISRLIPDTKYAKYIRNGVDVKPFTWFLLGYEYSKIVGKNNPKWIIINNVTGKNVSYEGRYLTCLLREEGNYTIRLTLEDNNGNKYEINRNIIVVDKDANYNIYQTFKKDYDVYLEEQQLRSIKELDENYIIFENSLT